MPEEVKRVRDDAIIATGRSDYPNQVNNVLCFPFIFRGALDVGATTITDRDGNRRRAARSRPRAGGAERCRCIGLRHHQPQLRSRIPDSQAVRSAADHAHRARGGAGRDGERRGLAADRRSRRLPRPAAAVRLSLRHLHEADLHDREECRRDGRQVAHRVRRGRGRARAARRPGRHRRRSRATDPDRPARHHRTPAAAIRAADAGRARTSS